MTCTWLQWGLGENPGRNQHAPADERVEDLGFNGAWAKTQEGTLQEFVLVVARLELQWGLGENPGRNTWTPGSARSASRAKTQEGTAPTS